MTIHARPAVRALAAGALAVGVLDIADAFIFFGLRGVQPGRILQSIAAGFLGPPAFQGGAATMALGLGLHFFIATMIVLVFYTASGRLPVLIEHPIRFGALYGIAAYLVMTFIVVPASASPAGPRSWPVVLNGLCIHIAGVGLPAALAARAARRGRT